MVIFSFLLHQAVLFGGTDSLPSFLARQYIPTLGVTLDPCAAILILIVTSLLCLGIKEVLVYILRFFTSLAAQRKILLARVHFVNHH